MSSHAPCRLAPTAPWPARPARHVGPPAPWPARPARHLARTQARGATPPHRRPLAPALAPALLALVVGACCSAGERRPLWPGVLREPRPRLVVYYPQHDTLDTWLMSTVLMLDGVPLARLCEGDFVSVPVTPGEHALSTSTDDDWGCSRPADHEQGWPPVALVVAEGDLLLVRFGDQRYAGVGSQASLCERRLTVVDEKTARREADILDRIAPD